MKTEIAQMISQEEIGNVKIKLMKKNYFTNLNSSTSPFSQIDYDSANQASVANNNRIMEEMQAKRLALTNEREHVNSVKGGVKGVVNDATSGNFTRTGVENNATFGPSGVDTARDVKGGELMDDNTFNWLNDTGGNSCIGYSCSILKQAGARVPQNDAGGVEIWQDKKNGGEGGDVWYKSGDPMPIVPWNQRFDNKATELGYELQPRGTQPGAGDIIRQGYDNPSQYLDGTGYDNIEDVPGTSHSVLATDTLSNNGIAAYNPGPVRQGIRTGTSYMNPNRFNASENPNGDEPWADQRIQRYVGSMPYLNKKMDEYRADDNNQLKSMNVDHLQSGIVPFKTDTSTSSHSTLLEKLLKEKL